MSSDKALVYVYRKQSVAAVAGVYLIACNGKPITRLYYNSYYPYLASPGTNQFGYALLSANAFLNTFIKDEDNFSLNTEAGKTYYLQYSTWKNGFVLKDSETGSREIAKCKLVKSLGEPPKSGSP